MLDKSRIEYLEKVDPDRFRSSLLAAQKNRVALQTFYAFHAELAKVPEMVSEPMIGAIRYQWWRDALDEIFTGKSIRQHDIARPLAELIHEKNISRFSLDSLINGRERDLDPEPFADIAAAKAYSRETSGRIMQIAAGILESNLDEERISDIGTCWGLTGLLRSWRYYHGGMLSKLEFQGLHSATLELFNSTRRGKLSPSIVPATAYVSLVPGYLESMAGPGYDPVTMAPQYNPLSKKWRLMKTALTGKI